MILYFSGTGNSEFAAKELGKKTRDEVVNLFEKIRNHDYAELYSDKPWVVAAPVYAWRIPRILHEWLEKTKLSGSRSIYFIITCGGNICDSGKFLEKLCASKGMDYLGCLPLVMPNNYLIMPGIPTEKEAFATIQHAETEIKEAASIINNKASFPSPSPTFKDRLSSSIANPFFYSLYIRPEKFYAEDTCISCGKCVDVCPLNNIHLEQGKPFWGKECTHCMSCICRCPAEAIEYGKQTKGVRRYTFPKE